MIQLKPNKFIISLTFIIQVFKTGRVCNFSVFRVFKIKYKVTVHEHLQKHAIKNSLLALFCLLLFPSKKMCANVCIQLFH